MPSEEEILKYVIDKSQAEAQLDQLQQRLEEFKAKRAAGEDTSQIEAQINKQITGLGKLADKEQETAGATEDLVKQKDKLSSVMRVLGGQSAGMVGDLGGVIELLMSMGPAAAGAATALAGLAIGSRVLQGIRRDAEDAKKAIKELIDAQKQLRDEGLSVQERVADAFQQAGIFGEAQAGAQAVRGIMADRGVEEEVATFGVAAQRLAGLSDEERRAAMAAFVASAGAAQFTGKLDEDRAMIRELVESGARPEAQAALLGRIKDVGEAVRRRAVPPADDPDWEAKQRRRETVIREYARTAQLTEEEERLIEETLRYPTQEAARRRWKDIFDEGWFGDMEDIPEGGRRSADALLGIAAKIRRELGESQPGAGQGQITLNIQEYRQNVGTMNNMADRKTRGWNPTWGVTPGDGSTIRTKHGM